MEGRWHDQEKTQENCTPQCASGDGGGAAEGKLCFTPRNKPKGNPRQGTHSYKWPLPCTEGAAQWICEFTITGKEDR